MNVILKTMERVPAPALLFGAIVSLQLGAVLAIGLFPLFGTHGVLFLRLALGSLLLCVLYRSELRSGWRQAPRGITLLGVLMAVMSMLFYESLLRLPLGIAVAIEFLGPLSVALATSRRWLDIGCVILAGGGILLLAPDIGAALDPIGVLYALGAGACWGGYVIVGQRLGKAVEGGAGLAIAMSIAALILLPIGGFDVLAQLPANIPSWPAILGVGMFSAGLPLLFEYLALKSMPAKTYGVLIAMEPVVATLVGFLMLGDSIGWRGWFAILLVSLASALAAWLAREKPAESV